MVSKRPLALAVVTSGDMNGSDLTAKPVITLTEVSFTYDGPPVIQRASFAIGQGDFVCVIGPNGGGKSTLLKLMLGLIEPNQGKVEVLGKSPRAARSLIGYMPQHAQLDPRFPVSVLDVVLMGRLGRAPRLGPYRQADKQVALTALGEVGMAELRRRPFAQLSGGQRQRVLIARALACEPELLLFDEPMANLDPVVQDDLYALLGKLNRKLTIVMVSHDIGFVSLYFKTVVCVNRTVHTHPMSELSHRAVADMYGREVRLLHHSRAPNARVEP